MSEASEIGTFSRADLEDDSLDTRTFVYLTDAQVLSRRALSRTLLNSFKMRTSHTSTASAVSQVDLDGNSLSKSLSSLPSINTNLSNVEPLKEVQKFKFNCWFAFQKYSVNSAGDDATVNTSSLGLSAKDMLSAINCVYDGAPVARVAGFLSENNITENQILSWNEFYYFCHMLLGPMLNLPLHQKDISNFQKSKYNNNHPYQQLIRKQRGVLNVNYDQLVSAPHEPPLIDKKQAGDRKDAVCEVIKRSNRHTRKLKMLSGMN